MSSLSATCLYPRGYYGTGKVTNLKRYESRQETGRKAITVTESSVLLNPNNMKVGHFYCAEIGNLPFLYRKINDREIEVYGLAEEG